MKKEAFGTKSEDEINKLNNDSILPYQELGRRRSGRVTRFIFGRTKEGSIVTAYCLENAQGAKATILDYGCTVQSLCMPNTQGGFTDVVLGYDSALEYEQNDGYVGAAIGRVANRIGRGEFALNGKTYKLAFNDGENHLHGGLRGFDKVIWNADAEGNVLVFTRLSTDGEEGYPGNLHVKVTYILTDDNELKIRYDAVADTDTIVSLTNHSYFNLNGIGTVLHHYLQMFASAFTQIDKNCLPTGQIQNSAGTPFDFKEPKQLGQDIDSEDVQLCNGNGYDHNFILSDISQTEDKQKLKIAAILYSAETGISMTAYTTLPGIQVYSGNALTPRKGKNGGIIKRRDAVCLETQVFPNAIAHAHFPSPLLRAGEHYHTETVYRFEVQKGSSFK